MKWRILVAGMMVLPVLFSCGEYKEYTEPDQAVAKKDYPIPPEYQEEYQALTKKVEHYHAGTLPTFDETHARAHSRIGFILFKAGDLQKARENLDRSINMDANIPETHLYLGEVLEALGNHEEAIKEYEAALKLDPSLAEAHQYLSTSYEQMGYHDQAVEEQKRYEAAKASGN
jgi:tetratricopeptide (TPR) repeat protein